MKFVCAIIAVVTLSGCYVPMPSVGVRPTKVQNYKKCWHTHDGKVACTHEQRWVK